MLDKSFPLTRLHRRIQGLQLIGVLSHWCGLGYLNTAEFFTGIGYTFVEDAFFGEQVAQQTLKWLFTWKRPSCDGKYVVITPEGFDAAKDLGGCSFQAHLRNVQALVPQDITPKLKRGKVASLYILGYKQFTTGINLRPVLPRQRDTIGFLRNFSRSSSIE